jgi:hypothetical protein
MEAPKELLEKERTYYHQEGADKYKVFCQRLWAGFV